MMRTRTLTRDIVVGMCAAVLALAWPGAAQEAVGEGPPPRPVRFHFDAGLLRAAGEVGFDEGGSDWRSVLEWPVDGWLAEFRLESCLPLPTRAVPADVRVRGRYARSLAVDGRSTDSDYDSTGSRIDYSESDAEGEVWLWDVDAALCILFPAGEYVVPLELGLLLGYGGQTFNFKDENLYANYSYGSSVYTQSGLVSTYDVDFLGWRLGAFVDVQLIDRFSVRLEGILIPYLRAQAEAYWVLRSYPFWQDAEGSGSILRIRADYDITQTVAVYGGWRYVSLIADTDGVEGGVLEGEAYENWPIVDEITAEYSAFEIGAAIAF